ncbi:hypothetical protein B6U74_05755 [Candidatus Bathyarchaeota archaeon ex4484_205]|nr:MAG: hypothetical protein B6U74_05755 [Candidatus Bathyarchaeota archaeon ex4484_205]RLG69449.1 MAG: DUF424 domain-containing protein [archaeon]
MSWFFIKLHTSPNGVVLAVCDAELLGKTIEAEDGLKLEVSEKFYGGEKVDEEELIRLLSEASFSNLLGEKAVKIAIDNGFAHPNSVISFGGVPHLIIMHL